MTGASRYLTALAGQIAVAYVAHGSPRAILLTGSAAVDESDYYSDIDLIMYYDQVPTEDQFASARMLAHVTDARISSSPEMDWSIEEYVVQGVECQVAHVTIASWERDMASVLEGFDLNSYVQKSIIGLQDGTALYGNELIGQWKAHAAIYPDGLAQATVEHHMQFFPLWLAAERWNDRDATIFYQQMLVESSLNLLGVLAGLNRLYYSAFQFKRLHQFVGKMLHAPERFAERLDILFSLDPVSAGNALESLVDETIALVEGHMPTMDTSPARRHLGVRHHQWGPVAK